MPSKHALKLMAKCARNNGEKTFDPLKERQVTAAVIDRLSRNGKIRIVIQEKDFDGYSVKRTRVIPACVMAFQLEVMKEINRSGSFGFSIGLSSIGG
jgi:hypothetical protein